MTRPVLPRRDGTWMDQALCAGHDPEKFFPGRKPTPASVRALCLACPVRQECLAHALALMPDCHGVWGGTSWYQRDRMLAATR